MAKTSDELTEDVQPYAPNENGVLEAMVPAEAEDRETRLLPRYREAMLSIVDAIRETPRSSRNELLAEFQVFAVELRKLDRDASKLATVIGYAISNLMSNIPPE